jgi:uncharacterized protein (DUF2062 family)
MMNKITEFFKLRLINPLLNFLIQGITPEKLSLAVVFGIILGIFPVLGTTTILCTTVALYLRLNMAAIQLVNYVMYPLQLICFIPFIRLGEFIFGQPPIPFSVTQIIEMIECDLLGTMRDLWVANLMGVFAWLLISIALSPIIYFITLRIFRKINPEKLQPRGLQ